MRRRVRENALIASLGVLASATMAWLGLYGFAWNDYEVEARPSFEALVHGHLLLFLRDAPVYGGSLVERAPFALLPGLWGGGELAVYRMVALPCLLAAAATRGVAGGRDARAAPLSPRARDRAGGVRGQPAHAARAGTRPPRGSPRRGAVRGGGAARAAGTAAVGRVGAGSRRSPTRSGRCWRWGRCCSRCPRGARSALPWPPRSQAWFWRRWRSSLRARSSPPRAAPRRPPARSSSRGRCGGSSATTGPRCMACSAALKPGFRTAPGWVGRASHPLIVALSLPLAGLFWWRRRGEAPPATDALGLLALLLLLRCMLDTWDVSYYPLAVPVRAARLGDRRSAPRVDACEPAPAAARGVVHDARVAELPVAARARSARTPNLRSSSPGRCRSPLLWECACMRREESSGCSSVSAARTGAAGRSLPESPLRRPRSAPWAAR